MNELAEFIRLPLEAIGEYDVGALNLRCANGLPGAESINEEQMLSWMDRAAKQVQFETARHWYRFTESPETYNTSAAYFCCYFLLQVLQEEFGVHYNPARVTDPKFQDPKCFDPDFRDSRDLFIHGMIDGPGGTCASMPVLYVAVGRRLGYPLKLVESRGHLFVRWDDPDGKCFGFPERFNVEGAGEGIASYDDEHYKNWPEPWTEVDEAEGWYLKSMTPQEELASFLSTRGDCLTDNGRLAEAVQAYEWASILAPDDKRYLQILAQTQHKYQIQQDRQIAFLSDMTQRNRQRRDELLSGTNSHPQPARPKFHEAMTTYNREMMEWNRRNSKGRDVPPVAPRAGIDYTH